MSETWIDIQKTIFIKMAIYEKIINQRTSVPY